MGETRRKDVLCHNGAPGIFATVTIRSISASRRGTIRFNVTFFFSFRLPVFAIVKGCNVKH